MDVFTLCEKAKLASIRLSSTTTEQKNAWLLSIADALDNRVDEILSSNAIDMARGENLSPVMRDRLLLTRERVARISDGVRDLVSLPDPVGRVLSHHVQKDGLDITRVSVPIGVVGVIYEARPNVTVDVATLCIKSGNCVVLRGGKDAINTNRALAKVVKEALGEWSECVQFIDDETRESTGLLLKADKYVDVIIPRGGEKLKEYILQNTKIPVICSAGGVCHTYVEKTADLKKAKEIVKNAKLQRPSVCNALETLLVDEEVAEEFLPVVLSEMKAEKNIRVYGDEATKAIYPDTEIIDEEGYNTEYLDYALSVKVVSGVEEAISHINTHGTKHSDAILTEDMCKAEKFILSVDTADVYVNASTRFTDGYEFGLGAEVAISTQKLHARGPVGLNELTTYKTIIRGNGQIRK
ncbi:MAG: glutamate-5-semialdehyde dehydrogenase [Clostridia bacterium]|nr:glutamate-5-semialdehyde dehydrogenase [Clostridia bacterium]